MNLPHSLHERDGFLVLPLNIRSAQPGDAAAIADIYAPIVRDTHLSAEFVPPDADEMGRRIEANRQTHPWLVADASGVIAGYAYAYPFRSRSAYQWCTEVSVYIHADYRRQGVARLLYEDLFTRLRDQRFRHAIAIIALPNPASVQFHVGMGFLPIGVFPGICHKLGRWYDIGWWRKPLDPGNTGAPISAPFVARP
jgi:L-amino acid N-acyltransferase YncA